MATSPRTTRRLRVLPPRETRENAHAKAAFAADTDEKPGEPAEPVDLRELENSELWDRYCEQRDRDVRNQLIERYFSLVAMIAQRTASRLPASVQVDDLTSAGVFGLMDAIDGFNPDYGVKFETYCSTRIRGAMLDEMRQLDWAPRQVRSSQTRLEHARATLETRLGRAPSDEDLMDHLNLSAGEFADFRRKADAAQITSLTISTDEDGESLSRLNVMANDSAVEPGEEVAVREVFPRLINSLSQNERIILVLYYHESMTMKEIGSIQGISESRVCQIHGKVVKRLRTIMYEETATS